MSSSKNGDILCEGHRLAAYRLIQKYNRKFRLRRLLRKFRICPNAYYNYLKKRKADYHRQKKEIKNTIGEIYTVIEEFAYVQYNHVRPHSDNDYKMPYEALYGVA